jgi:hypothetical protein
VEAAEALVATRGYALVGGEVTVANPHTDVARGLYERMGYRNAGLGEFVSGYTYWDASGTPQPDEERYCYITKRLS